MSQRRQLSAILFTDMIGYTAMMSRDEALAMKLRLRHREVLQACHEQYKGEIIQYFGDGTLSVFNSTVEAVRCAVDIQRTLQEEPKVPLRIGLHSGEVVWDEEGIYGSSINIASRLESFAVEGAILTSGKVRDELANHRDFQFRSLGLFQLKNVPKPMEIFAVANEGIKVPDSREMDGKGRAIDPDGQESAAKPAPKTETRPPTASAISQGGIAVNDLLIDSICEELATYSRDLDDELNKAVLDIPSIKREIVDAFPTPIGEQLRILFTRSNNPGRPHAMELYTVARLLQLAVAHRTTLQFICFIQLSQLWDEKVRLKDIRIEAEQLATIKHFLVEDARAFNQLDFARVINTIWQIFEQCGIGYFISEFKELRIHPDQDTPLYEAHRFLLDLHQDLLQDKIQQVEVEEKCLQAEEHLGTILKKVAFLIKYKLVTIKNIEIVKGHHEIARFRHRQITLNKALTVASTGVAEVGIEFANYADNKSVLFIKAEQNEISDYLNLTPFIIDENALNSDYSSKIFLFVYQNEEAYYYQFLNNPIDNPLEVNKWRYPRVKDQFDRFRADIFAEELPPATRLSGKRSASSRFMRKK